MMREKRRPKPGHVEMIRNAQTGRLPAFASPFRHKRAITVEAPL
jgi:hypothetical protein